MKETLSACAKINLHLRILKKRPDGYHDLETLFQEIDLCDQLSFTPISDSISVHSAPETLLDEKDNLIYRAALLLKEKSKSRQGCEIRVHKNIPLGAGLGGGSSDAATTLLTLNRLWNTHLKQQDLLQLALQLGSDVPFFLSGGLALAYGRGEKLVPLQIRPKYSGVLVYPDFGVSTAWAYKNNNFVLTKSTKNTKFIDPEDIQDPSAWHSRFCNDLEPAVFRQHSALPRIHRFFVKQGAFYTRMSGSGSSIYGLFFDPAEAEAARYILQKTYTAFLFQPVYRDL